MHIYSSTMYSLCSLLDLIQCNTSLLYTHVCKAFRCDVTKLLIQNIFCEIFSLLENLLLILVLNVDFWIFSLAFISVILRDFIQYRCFTMCAANPSINKINLEKDGNRSCTFSSIWRIFEWRSYLMVKSEHVVWNCQSSST